jgi:DNA gyrase subunit A
VLVTRNGTVKRVAPDVPGAAGDWQVIRLEDADVLIFGADLITGDEELIFITSDAQLLRFAASLVRPQGRPAGGVAGINLSSGARVVAAAAIPATKIEHAYVTSIASGSSLLPGTASGTAKLSPLSEYPRKGRATGGVRCHKFLKGEDVLVAAATTIDVPIAHASNGIVVTLPQPKIDKRDGSGDALDKVVNAIGSRL